MDEEDIQYALDLAIELLEEHCPNYEINSDVDVILDIYNNFYG